MPTHNPLCPFHALAVLPPKHSRRPALKGGHGEQGHHPGQDIVEVEVTVVPHTVPHHWVQHVTILVHNECAPGAVQGGQGKKGTPTTSLPTSLEWQELGADGEVLKNLPGSLGGPRNGGFSRVWEGVAGSSRGSMMGGMGLEAWGLVGGLQGQF